MPKKLGMITNSVYRSGAMITPRQIRAARAMLDVKQKELAAAAGVSLATLNNIERGVADPRSSTLGAIERALDAAGVRASDDGVSEEVRLIRMTRPSAYDTYFASQRVLETIGGGSLTKILKILFFVRKTGAGAGDAQGPGHFICLLIEGKSRAILFDQVNFNLGNDARAAEVAGIMLAGYAFHANRLYYLDQILEDTTTSALPEAIRRLREYPWRPMEHPRDFFAIFDDWEGRILGFARRAGHPMRNLVALLLTRTQT